MPAQNPRAEGRLSASDPAFDGLEFTGTADVTVPTHSRGVYIASDGNLKVDMVGYAADAAVTTITFVGVKGGSILPICISKIYDTGTTVSGVVLF